MSADEPIELWEDDLDGGWGCRIDAGVHGVAFGCGDTKAAALTDACHGLAALLDVELVEL